MEQRGLPAQTKNTVTDRDALFEELEQIRERGYAYNDEEEIRGFRAIAAPIEDPSGEVLGSVSVSGPTSLLQGEQFQEHVPKLVTQSANVIEVNINMNTQS
nr:IclR family transcriptional regulator C-terminal domain-containing protein [Haloferax denitrificans]